MKKLIAFLSITILALGLFAGCSSKQEDVVAKVYALKGPTSMGMVKMISDQEGKEKKSYEFTIAGSPDEITPKLINGEVDIAAVPANLASVLYNKSEGKVVNLAINTLGVLYIVENGNTVKTINDLKGKTIYASGKGATPEYALNHILKENGIDPQKDVKIEFKSEHTEVLAAILSNKNSVAMLPEPFVTTATIKNNNIKVAIDMNKEWEKLNSKNSSSLVTGVVVARKEFVEKHPEAVKAFLDEYKKSVEYTNGSVKEASLLIEKNNIVPAKVAEKAIPSCNITFISGNDMKTKLEGYLNTLYNQNPKSIGGKMPSEDFYYIQK